MTWKIHCGDALEVLKTLPEASVNCCVTSPPYWGLRDYGCEGQLGLEKTPEEYVAKLVGIFREVRRVLRNDGVLWLNLGDSYVGNASPGGAITGLKTKDLVGIPWMSAFALRADGWFLRSDCIWAKLNVMPESVLDRPTKAHEYIFLFSKTDKYFFSHTAVGELSKHAGRIVKAVPDGKLAESLVNDKKRHATRSGFVKNDKLVGELRNVRTVWHIPNPQPFRGAHFATFPWELARKCINAGCPKGGTVLDPFAGAGTSGLVACYFGCKFIGVELNPEYVSMAEKRISASAEILR